ncbi:hypothetical protein RQP46_008902 [Phenoliferia psychrophenolica]
MSAPLYSFQLPAALLGNLSLRKVIIPTSHSLYRAPEPSPSDQLALTTQSSTTPRDSLSPAGAFTCTLTGAAFNDLAGLREHYKTDWYKYNVKLRLQGKPTGVSEDEFNALVEGLSSISGSDSSDSASSASDAESTSSSTNAVSRLLQKQKLARKPAAIAGAEEDELDPAALSGPRSAVIWFEAHDHAPGTQFGVYRAILPEAGTGKKREEGDEVVQELRRIQVPEVIKGVAPDRPRQWTLLMFGGGHFAGMVVSLVPRMVSKGKGKEKDREVVVIQKKTFHRYTTRRKQGGSQGANDNAKGKASSMGAQIRRHNEDALRDEVQELLVSWTADINASELVFLRCSKTNYKTFFGYDKAPLDKKDPRIRGFSFPTKRPTLNELVRAFTELTRVKTSHLTADALALLDASYLSSITPLAVPTPPPPKLSLAPKPFVPKLSKAEELDRDRWTRLVDMVRKGKTDAVAAFLDKYGPELEQPGGTWGALPEWMDESRTAPTLLHVASAADQPEVVRWLLVEKRADPTLEASVIAHRAPPPPPPLALSEGPLLAITSSSTSPPPPPTPTRSMTPYELAPSRATRNVFRLLTTSNPDWWDWTGTGPAGCRVPSGLTEDQEESREQKTRDRRGKMREKLKEREGVREERERAEKEEQERIEKAEKERIEEELRRKGGSRIEKKGPQRLGGGPPRAIVNREMNEAGLTDEQRMRVQREQRARAAEARFGK